MPILSADMVEREVVATLFHEARLGNPDALRRNVTAAMEQQRNLLLAALTTIEQRLTEQAELRRAALNALADTSLSPLVKQAMMGHAEEQIRAYEALEEQKRVVQAGLDVLTMQARSVQGIIDSPDLDPARMHEPAVMLALKRLIRLMVKRATLIRCNQREFMVELAISEILPDIRDNGSGESAWESNPPAQLVTTPTGFEDQGSHRATSALD